MKPVGIGIALFVVLSVMVVPASADWRVTLEGDLVNESTAVLGDSTEMTPSQIKPERIEGANAKLRLLKENDMLRLRLLNAKGDRDLGAQKELLMEGKNGERIKVSTGSADKMRVLHNLTPMETKEALMLDLKDNGVLMGSPAGERKIKRLPDAIVKELLQKGIITSSPAGAMELETKNGEPIYRLEIADKKRFLGLFLNRKRLEVSAETGEATEAAKTRLEWLRNFLSF